MNPAGGHPAQASVSIIGRAGITKAATTNETQIYNTSTGSSYGDANGTKRGGLTLLAALSNKAVLPVGELKFV